MLYNIIKFNLEQIKCKGNESDSSNKSFKTENQLRVFTLLHLRETLT